MRKQNQLPTFTPEQLAAMEASKNTIDALRKATPPHIGALTLHPRTNQPIIDEHYTQRRGFTLRTFQPPLENVRSVTMHRFTGDIPSEPLTKTWPSFRRGLYAPYAALRTTYVGMVETSYTHGPIAHDRMSIIDAPNTAVHGLGLIISSIDFRGTPLKGDDIMRHGFPDVERVNGSHIPTEQEAVALQQHIELAAQYERQD